MGPGRASRQPSPLDAAYRYLGYRPRSEFEMRTFLEGKGFGRQAIDSTLSTLKSKGLLDDVAFARYWRESRESSSPRSRAALVSELRRKGVDPEVVAAALDGVDEEAAAYAAARKSAARLGRSDRGEFRGKLAAALRRRGFSYEVTERTVNRLWQESRSHG